MSQTPSTFGSMSTSKSFKKSSPLVKSPSGALPRASPLSSDINNPNLHRSNSTINSGVDDVVFSDPSNPDLNPWEKFSQGIYKENFRISWLKPRQWLSGRHLFWFEDVTQILFSILACILFVWSTYETSPSQDNFIFQLEFILTIAFIWDYVISYWLAEHKWKFIKSYMSLVDIITIVPFLVAMIFNLGTTFAFFRFLRLLRVLRILRLYRLRDVQQDEFRKQSMEFGIIMVSIIFISAGLIYQFELADRGELFHTAIYVTVITISTVGFGDIAPITDFGRLVTSLVILVSLYVVPNQLNKLGAIMKNRNPYHKEVESNVDYGHVLLIGSIDSNSLQSFIVEFFHKDHGSGINRSLVIVSPNKPDTLSTAILSRWDETVSWFQGDVLNDTDLEFLNLSRCKAAFVVSRDHGHDTFEEDKKTCVRALSVQLASPTLPIYVKLVLTDFVDTLATAGIFHGISLSERKLQLLSKSLVVPGFSTLVSNMTRTTSFPLNAHELDRWKQEFLLGSGHEIYKCVLPRDLIKMPFPQLSALLFQIMNTTTFAILVPSTPSQFCQDCYRQNPNLGFWGWLNWWGHSAIMDPEDIQVYQKISSAHPVPKPKSTLLMNPKDYICQGGETVFMIFQDSTVEKEAAEILKSSVSVESSLTSYQETVALYPKDISFNSTQDSCMIPSYHSKRVRDDFDEIIIDPSSSSSSNEISQKSLQGSRSRSQSKLQKARTETSTFQPQTQPQTQVQPLSFQTMVFNQSQMSSTESNATPAMIHPHLSRISSRRNIPALAPDSEVIKMLNQIAPIPKCFWVNKHPIPFSQAVIPTFLPNSVKDHIVILAGAVVPDPALVEPLRYKVGTHPVPIVFLLSDPDMDLDFWPPLANYPHIYFIFGSTNKRLDLWRAGVQRAHSVLILSPSATLYNEFEASMIDSDVLVSYKLVTQMAKVPNIVIEVHNQRNIRLLGKDSRKRQVIRSRGSWYVDSLSSSKDQNTSNFFNPALESAPGTIALSDLGSRIYDGEDDDDQIIEEEEDGVQTISDVLASLDSTVYPGLASGRVFIPSALDALLGMAFYNPEINRILELFVSTCPIHESAADIYLISLPPAFHGKEYGDLYAWLSYHGAIPLGLYRSNVIVHSPPEYSQNSLKTKASKFSIKGRFLKHSNEEKPQEQWQTSEDRYVYTGPMSRTGLRQDDMVYILSELHPEEIFSTPSSNKATTSNSVPISISTSGTTSGTSSSIVQQSEFSETSSANSSTPLSSISSSPQS